MCPSYPTLDVNYRVYVRVCARFEQRLLAWMSISASVSLVVGVLSLSIFRKRPTLMAYFAVGMTLVIPLGVAIAGLVVGLMPLAYVGESLFLLVAALTISLGRKRIRMCARLFRAASTGLQVWRTSACDDCKAQRNSRASD